MQHLGRKRFVRNYKNVVNKLLNQEYIIVAALALADALAGFAYFVTGAWRIGLIYAGLRNTKVGLKMQNVANIK
jgi:hypothetical protein